MSQLSRDHRLLEILDAIAGLPSAEQNSYIDEHCADDPELQSEIRHLLKNTNKQPTQELAAVAFQGDQRSIGTEAGPFTLIKKIGEGGMGTVYLARHNRLNRNVAVKFIRQGRFATEDERQRFALEQKSLSHLSHPHIVTIFEAGFLDDDQPYYAMEYIEGTPLNTFCDITQLTIAQRVSLFIAICKAVHHAHKNLIVHRDLKPGNILVQTDGIPKLLDFGIAKALEAPDTPATESGMRIMTPQYAAPEQISGGPITVETDVYGLGIVLYELLAGCRPFDDSGNAKHEIIQAVLEATPPRPSIAAGASDSGAIHPAQRKRHLSGDLDTIILKALQKEPGRRYNTALELADDLERYLNGHPVLARPDSVTYRFGKFVRRHQTGVALGAASTVLLLITGLLYVINITQAQQEAERAQLRAERVRDFTIELLKPADPNIAQGDTLTAIDILARSSERLRTELKDEPEILAEMLDVVGEIYGGLGQYEIAIPLLEESVSLRRGWVNQNPLELATSLKHLGAVQIAINDLPAAHTNLQEAYTYASSSDNANPIEAPALLDLLGHVAFLEARYDDAESYIRQAVSGFDAVPVDNLTSGDRTLYQQGLASSLNNLGIILFYVRQNIDDAKSTLLRAYDLYQTLYPDQPHTDLISINNSLGEVNRRQGAYDASLPYYEEALKLSRALLGVHQTTAIMASNLAVALQQKGCTPEIRPYLEEVLAIRKVVLEPTHPSMGLTYHNLASNIQKCENNPVDAIPLFTRALEIFKASLQPDDLRFASTFYQLAEAHRQLGQYERALTNAQQALHIRRKKLTDPHSILARSEASVGLIFNAWQMPDSAIVYLKRSLNQFDRLEHPNVADLLTSTGALSDIFVAQGRCADALPLLETRLELIEKARPENTSELTSVLAKRNLCKTR